MSNSNIMYIEISKIKFNIAKRISKEVLWVFQRRSGTHSLLIVIRTDKHIGVAIF